MCVWIVTLKYFEILLIEMDKLSNKAVYAIALIYLEVAKFC